MKKYTEPKIYHGGKNFDLSKRWYVYYSFLNPVTGIMTRQSPIYLKINQKYKTKKERLLHFNFLREALSEMLRNNHNPYESESIEIEFQAGSCIDYAWSVKKNELKGTTLSDYKSRIFRFKKFLQEKGLLEKSMKNITKTHVSTYLDTFKGAKNRNNTRTALDSIFVILSDANYIDFNFISELRVRKVQKKKAKIYTGKQILDIEKKLEEENETLLMYIYFVSYMFWRPIEIVRMKDADFDFKANTISVETKTDARKTKIIPELILDRVKKFVKDKKGFVFKSNNPDWHLMKDQNKRQHYTDLFKKFREKHGIDSSLKLYSFKHTFITKLYLELRKKLSKKESIEKLSVITGHSSNAINNYITVNDLELPEDYSEMLKG
jgi:integrase